MTSLHGPRSPVQESGEVVGGAKTSVIISGIVLVCAA
jgi:hypothetical protein